MNFTFKPLLLSSRKTAQAIGSSLVALVLATAVLSIAMLRGQAEAQWQSDLETLSMVLAAHTSQSMNSAYRVLDDITEGLRQQPLGGDDALRQASATPAIHRMLRDKAGASPQIEVAALAALNGEVITSSRTFPTPQIKLAYRDYFKRHQDNPRLEVFVSQPIENQDKQARIFYISRRLDDSAGHLAGLLIVGVNSQFFTDFHDRVLEHSKGRTIGLLDRDGTVLAHSSIRGDRLATVPGGSLREAAPVTTDLTTDLATVDITPSPGAVKPARAEAQGLTVDRALEKFPLVIRTGVSNELLYRRWHAEVATIASVSAAALLALLTCFTLLDRILKRREHELANALSLRRQAEAANLAKSRFLATISHEIRTPLAAVLGFSEMLIETPMTAMQREFAVTVHESGRSLLTLTEKILDFRKIEAGQLAIHPAAFDPAELVSEVVRLFAAHAQNKGLVLAVKIDTAAPAGVAGDAVALRQVLANLVENGIKFTQTGSVVVELKAAGDSTRAHHAQLQFRVTDTGIGIAAAAQRAAFEPFNQIDNTLEREFGGSGLGLAICQRLVGLMGSEIKLSSAPGRGATFWFDLCLPVATLTA